jgi:CrcB protein
MKALFVIAGAAVGAPSRYLLDLYFRKYIKYPYGITIINVLGAFIIGLSIGPADNFRALVAIGFAGAFTTWSTFMLDLYLAFELKQYKTAATNLVVSLVLGLCAAWLGIHLAQ